MNNERRERISRELCAQFGYIYQEGEWLGGIHEDEPVYWPLRCALIDARCRVGELELTLRDAGMIIRQLLRTASDGQKERYGDFLRRKGLQGSILRESALALREEEPKV